MSLQASDIEQSFAQLPRSEQLRLLERLVRRLRAEEIDDQDRLDRELMAMSADREIQSEIHNMEAEFAPADGDGLEAV